MSKIILYGEKTKSGFVAITEYGGCYTNKGKVRLVARQDGSPATATFLYQKGKSACKSQALIPVLVGYKVLIGGRKGDDIQIRLYNVEAINMSNNSPIIVLREINHYQGGRWYRDLFGKYEAMVAAARKKLYDYNCCKAYFVEVKPHTKGEDEVQPAQNYPTTAEADNAGV